MKMRGILLLLGRPIKEPLRCGSRCFRLSYILLLPVHKGESENSSHVLKVSWESPDFTSGLSDFQGFPVYVMISQAQFSYMRCKE